MVRGWQFPQWIGVVFGIRFRWSVVLSAFGRFGPASRVSVIACSVGWVALSSGLRLGNNRLLVTKPSMQKFNRFMVALVALVALFVGNVAHATDADPTTLYSGLTAPFNAALVVSLGFIGTLLIVRWVVRAIRAR